MISSSVQFELDAQASLVTLDTNGMTKEENLDRIFGVNFSYDLAPIMIKYQSLNLLDILFILMNAQ